jgi:dihydrofolate reductase
MSCGLYESMKSMILNNCKINIIAAIGLNNELGYQNKLLWNIPSDLKRFKELTMNSTIIMGKNTYNSIGKELKGRTNFVVSSSELDVKYRFETLIKAINSVKTEECFLIGGKMIYEEGLKYCDRVYLTQVLSNFDNCDVFFPTFNKDNFFISKESVIFAENNYKYKFIDYEIKKS